MIHPLSDGGNYITKPGQDKRFCGRRSFRRWFAKPDAPDSVCMLLYHKDGFPRKHLAHTALDRNDGI